MTTMNCLECDGLVTLPVDPLVGEVLECPDCGVELEVIDLAPLALALAPEIEEDWGE